MDKYFIKKRLMGLAMSLSVAVSMLTAPISAFAAGREDYSSVTEHLTSEYEPLVDPASIERVLPKSIIVDRPSFYSAYRVLTDIAEALDISNVKIVLDRNGNCMFQSRTPIPFPKGSLSCEYKKAVGIECFNKAALDFFVGTPMGVLEKIEDIDHLRFIENGVNIHYTKIESVSLSVDTESDLEKVREIFRSKEDE